jgi:hypothetical protein
MESNTDKIYLIGSKLNGNESVIARDNKGASLLSYNSFDDAKHLFDYFYNILLAPSFQPSNPPTDAEANYHREFIRLIAFGPVILELDKKNHKEEVNGSRKRKLPIFKTKTRFYNNDYWHYPVRTGFFKQFGILDIVQDIETSPFVGPNGKMVIRVNQVSGYSDNAAGSPDSISQEAIDEILRKRGYL